MKFNQVLHAELHVAKQKVPSVLRDAIVVSRRVVAMRFLSGIPVMSTHRLVGIGNCGSLNGWIFLFIMPVIDCFGELDHGVVWLWLTLQGFV